MKLITVIGLLTAIFQTGLRAATLQEVAPLAYPRVLPRSEMMADGRILVLGGYDESGLPVATVEIFNPGDPSDPTTSSWTPGPAMNEARYVPTLTRLKNGKFLVTGGYNGVGATATVEIYDSTVTDPLVNPWSYAAPMLAARYTHTATLLPDGRVLVAGGYDNSWGVGSAEIYDPVANTWTSAGTMSVTDRFWHTATLIGSDRVLVAGSPTSPVCEVYNVVSNTWTTVGSMAENRYCHSTVLLPSGKVMVIGGYDYSSGSTRASTEIFDPATGLWTSGGSMAAGRYFATAVNDGNGHVYVVGGYDAGSGAVGGVESYSIVPGTWTAVSGLSYYSLGAAGNLLANGSVVIAGGSVSGSASTSSIVLVLPAPPEDADFDGLTFAEEVVMGYDPSSEDTGHTGVSDAFKDLDGDGFSNLHEIRMASSRAAGFVNSMNPLSDNSLLAVGATRLNTGRFITGLYASIPTGGTTFKTFAAPWVGTFPGQETGPIQHSKLPADLRSAVPFITPKDEEQFDYTAFYEAHSTLQVETGSLQQSAGLRDARLGVQLEPSIPFPTTYFYFVQENTLGPASLNDWRTSWSSFSLTVPAGKNASPPKDILIAAAAPVDRGNGFATTVETRIAYPAWVAALAFPGTKPDPADPDPNGPGLPTGALVLADDAGDPYSELIWLDPKGTGKPLAHYQKKGNLAGLPGKNEAIAFIKDSTPVLSGLVHVPDTTEEIKLKGECVTIPTMDFPETVLPRIEITPVERAFSNRSLSGTVGSAVRSTPEGIEFKWKLKIGAGDWTDIGSTKHRFYVTAAKPLTAKRQETMFRISCEGKDIEGIWSKFELGNIKRLDGLALTYYKNWTVAPPSDSDPGKGLLATGDGQCGAWINLLKDCWAIQGFDVTQTGRKIQSADGSLMAIKVWTTNPSFPNGNLPSQVPAATSAQGYKWANRINSGNEVSSGPTYSYLYPYTPNGFTDGTGVAGQGPIANPRSQFLIHLVLEMGGAIYDPSYGKKYITNQSGTAWENWEASAVDGFILPFSYTNQISPGVSETISIQLFKPNPPGRDIPNPVPFGQNYPIP